MAKRKRPDVSQKEDTKKTRKPFAEEWSKSKKKRMRRLKAKQKKKLDAEEAPTAKAASSEATSSLDRPQANKTKSSALQESFKARLTGSRFRELNEELYTTNSDVAFNRFSNNPELYEQYHQGFRHQVEQWPVNPVNVISKWLVTNFRKQSSIVVADFGCGDAALAERLLKFQYKGKCPFTVHSFDLVAANEHVTACDMAHVPLDQKSVDVAVFCLALMGTNLADFIREAHRVLKDNGILKIAEVRSRFESTDGKDGLDDFTEVLDKLGFKCLKKDPSNKMFVLLELKKNGRNPNTKLAFTAKPCIYKRR